MKTPELKNNNNLSGFICCHKLSGYLLLPIRLAIFAIFNVINLIVIFLNAKGILPYDLSYSIFKLSTDIAITCCGLTVNIVEDKDYEDYKKLSKNPDNKYIIVFSHRNFLDMYAIFTSLHEHLTAVVYKEEFSIFPFSYFAKFMGLCPVSKEDKKNGGTTKIIKEMYEKNTHKICIAPDGAKTYMTKEEIEDYQKRTGDKREPKVGKFRSGAFANKTPILPIVISAVGSTIPEVDWDDRPCSMQETICKILVDGNVELNMKFLPLQTFDEEKHKDVHGYKEDIREKMCKEHAKLPQSTTSNLEHVKQTSEECIKFVISAFTFIAILCYVLKEYRMGLHCVLVVLSGLLYHGFPTNNTAFLDRLAVFTSSLLLLLKVKNTLRATMFKFALLFFSLFQCLKNHCLTVDDFNQDTDVNKADKSWLYHHVYSVQLPGALATLITLIDHVFFVKN